MLFILMLGVCPEAGAREGLYPFSAIDFFALKGRQEAWVDAGGYVAPMVVTALLDDPNEKTARQYLQWMQERLEKISRAQRVLEEVEKKSPGEVIP